MKKIRVIAAEGRRVPIHGSVASGVGGRLLVVDDKTPVELPLVSYVRRRMRKGDLLEVKASPAPASKNPSPRTAASKES